LNYYSGKKLLCHQHVQIPLFSLSSDAVAAPEGIFTKFGMDKFTKVGEIPVLVKIR
jgi:hypothetical protein